MSKSPKEYTRHPDELLPWFVNGTLSDQERHEVEQHLTSCTQCQQEMTLLQKMRTQIKETHTQSPGEFGLNRLLNEVRTEQAIAHAQPQPQAGWWRTGLAIAASLIILLQAGLLLDAWYLSKPMVPLSGPQEQGPILQVSFEPTATEAQIRKVITEAHTTFIDGPSSLGLYRLRLNPPAMDKSSLEQTIQQLRQHTSVIHHVAQE